ncbi:MAG TPA: sigma-54 dependent transcriptional regulator [Thermodesulfovibrionales bacterium]|nr:sigma-54 dependent transcriptional regulator [Thermodesulfovibrionales bacterium]
MRGAGKGEILIVDDEPNAVKVLSSILSEDGYEVRESNDVDSATRIIHKMNIDAIITDLKMPGKDGLELFGYISKNHPDIPVIFLTAYGTVESAVSAMTCGAYYYFIKPPDYTKLKGILARAVEKRRLGRELASIKRRLANDGDRSGIIGTSEEMRGILDTIQAVRDSASSVLICGETGTGKELVARELHYGSSRKDRPFIAFNCAAIPRELVESELFGYERGAFTGAVTRRIGRFEEVAGGTLLLDEIGELELSMQAKLLRVLQEKEIGRLGSNRDIKVDFRLVSSTNRDLKKEVRNGTFREDLFYRINVVQIDIPPLRQRQEDIPLLVREFIKEFCVREKKTLTASEEVMTAFKNYPWPGNIRQLRNVIERAVVLAKTASVTLNDLPDGFCLTGALLREGTDTRQTLKELESQAVEEALLRCNGNKSQAAKKLGISRKALYKKLSSRKHLLKEDQDS